WFVARRGLAMGVFAASSATGQLVFLPMLVAVVESEGWRAVAWIVAAAAGAIIPIVYFLLPDGPADVGHAPYGHTGDVPVAAPRTNPLTIAFSALGLGTKSRDFWLLFASFFVCGAST